MRSAFVKYSLCVTLLNPVVALAADGDWKVAKTSQSVKYALDGKNWIAVHPGDIVPNGAWVSTGPRGRVQLTRGVESVSFQPDTLASIVTTGTSDSQTEITQQMGTLDLEIEHRDHPHAKVETPFLAAVVKGTIFRVSVTAKKASVAVTRGLVQVRSFASGQQSNVGPTQSATVSAVAGMAVKGIDVTPQIISVPPTVSPVQASSVPSTKSKVASTAASPDVKSSTSQSNANSRSLGSSGGGDGGNSGHGSSSTASPSTSASGGSEASSSQAAGSLNNGASSNTDGTSGNANGRGNSVAEGAGNTKNKGAKTNDDNGSGKDKGNKGNNGNAYGHDDGKGIDKGK